MKKFLYTISLLAFIGVMSILSSCNKTASESNGIAKADIESILQKDSQGKELSDDDIAELLSVTETYIKEMEQPIRDYNKAQRTNDVELERRAKLKGKKVEEEYYYMEDVKSCLDNYMYDMNYNNKKRYEAILDKIDELSYRNY